jgi:hypothetical protein
MFMPIFPSPINPISMQTSLKGEPAPNSDFSIVLFQWCARFLSISS